MPDAAHTLFDESILRSIMLSTSNSVIEYIRENGTASAEEITGFIEDNAEDIVSDTIRDLKELNGIIDKEVPDGRDDDLPQTGPDDLA